ncbi:MAG: carboxypeptidase regulatory-like domain-containing protein [Acidobacteria bacterium]|nr:carboxypeptidase regulatory-like domain-containing protein [Acidobacteriota bacterium]
MAQPRSLGLFRRNNRPGSGFSGLDARRELARSGDVTRRADRFKRRWLALLMGLVAAASSGITLAQQAFQLPQIANGRFAGGVLQTTFVVFNVGASRATVTIALTGDDGSPLRMGLTGFEASDRFTFVLEAGESRRLQSDGAGPATAGSARVTSTGPIGVSAVFTIFDERGNFLTEAGVGVSEPLTDFVVPVDASATFNTGLALFSNEGAVLTLRLLNLSGIEVAQTTVNLGSNGHIARFVSGPGEFFPSIGAFRGTLAVTSTKPVSAVALRQNSSPLSFTTLPVVSRSSSQIRFNLAQVANGPFSGGIIRTSFLVFNISSVRATVTVSLTRDDGSGFVVTIPGAGTASTFTITLEPGGSAFLETDGSGTLTAGAATVTSSAPIGVAAIFTIADPQGRFLTEAGVGDAALLDRFSIPVDVAGPFDTGVAFFNPAAGSVTLVLTLLDGEGNVIATQTIILGSQNHLARFLSELFPSAFSKTERSPAGAVVGNFHGSLAISASSPLAAVTLRQNASPLSFTTLPVAAGASPGRPPRPAPLLSQTLSGINATADATADVTLPLGLRLSGRVQGAGQASSVIAQGEGRTVLVGAVDRDTGQYVIAVPPDRYRLATCVEPLAASPNATVRTFFQDPEPVQVSADTRRDITLPETTTFPLSASISGLGTLPSLTSPLLVLSSTDGRIGATVRPAADGSFQAQLPAASYTASMAGQIEAAGGGPFPATQTLSIFNIGSATVAGAATSASFTVPATAALTGTLRGSGVEGTPFIVVFARDTSVPQFPELGCAPTASFNITLVPEPARDYRLTLATGRTHAVSLSVPVVRGPQQVGSLALPLPARQIAFSAATAQDFDVPALPRLVIISGRVTDAAGRPVPGTTVIAVTSEVTGIPGSSFSAVATTAADGSYRMEVLSGTNYQLIFFPPPLQP